MTLVILIVSVAFASFALTKRPSGVNYEEVQGFEPISRPVAGALVFTSMAQLTDWQMGRAAVMKGGSGFDFDKNSLLAVWIGKPQQGECVAVDSIDEKDGVIEVRASAVKCSDRWNKPYIYYKIEKTDKKAVLK